MLRLPEEWLLAVFARVRLAPLGILLPLGAHVPHDELLIVRARHELSMHAADKLDGVDPIRVALEIVGDALLAAYVPAYDRLVVAAGEEKLLGGVPCQAAYGAFALELR